MKSAISAGVSAAMLAALCGTAQGQFVNDDRSGADVLGVQRIPMLPNADDDSNEMRIAPVIVCFAPGTDPRYIAAVEAIVKARNDAVFGPVDYFTTTRWAGSVGTPVNIRWSFAPDGLSIPGGTGEPTSNSTLFASFDSGFASQGGRATWTNRFTQCFARWAQLSGNTYTRITVGGTDWDDGAAWGTAGAAGARGDVRISAHPIDGGSNVLAYNQFPSNGDMVLDSQDLGNFAGTANSNRFLRDTVMHEHGHGTGLLHSCSNDSNILMAPFINTAIDGPTQDDIRAIHRLYGDINAATNTVALAKDLGSVSAGTVIGPLGVTPPPVAGTSDVNSAVISLDQTLTSDYYKITTTGAVALSVTATPKGSPYQNAAQAGDGSCPGTGSTNGLTAADLAITVFASNGTTVVASANATGAGSPESIVDLILNTAGVYYIRINAASVPTTQLYTLAVSATATQTVPEFTTQPQQASQYCSGGTITFTAAAHGLPAPTLQWRKGGVPLSNGGSVSGVTTGTLTITPSALSDAGVYDCVATNVNGSTPSNPVNVAFSDLVFTQQPANQTVPDGGLVTLTVATTPVGTAWQWKQDGFPIFIATGPTYSFNAFSGDEGVYTCDVTGPCGVQTSNGATVAFTSTACYANCDGSTGTPLLSAADFACFLAKFRAGDAYANCDGSTGTPSLTAADFACYLTAFRAGCP